MNNANKASIIIILIGILITAILIVNLFQASVSFKDNLQSKKYNKLVEQIHIDIVNLSDLLRGMPKDIDFSEVDNHLEQLVTVLSQFENALKFHI